MSKRAGIFVGVFVAIIIWASWMGSNNAPPSQTPVSQEDAGQVEKRRQAVTTLTQNGGVVRMDCLRSKANINPVLWAALDADGKERFTKLLAAYCRDTSKVYAMDMIDNQSGKTLASVGSFSGYSVK